MKLLLLAALSCLLVAQTPGTVSQATTSTVTGTAGTLTCTLTNSSPALPSGVHVACSVSGAAVLVMDSVVTAGNNGMVGSFTQTGNTVTWIVTLPTAGGSYNWQMAANGVGKTGAF